MDEFAFELLRSGILAVKEGDITMAQRQLDRAINLAEDRTILADAWFWMSESTQDPHEKRTMLESALAYDLHHAQARRSLAILDGKLSPDEIIDPEILTRGKSISSQASTTERFTCQKCGGKMTYAPDGYNLVCDYCNRHQSIKADALLEEQDFIIAMATARGHQQPSLLTSYKCQGCGADFLLAPGVISSDCTFCNSAHVVALDNLNEFIEPDCIIPMVLKQRQAIDQLNKWLHDNRVEPDKLPNPARGLYLPLWSFDIGGHIAWSGDRIQNKKVVTVKGEDIVSFNDLAIPASRSFSNLLDRMVGGYDLINAPAYDTRYLAGWPAKVYEIPMAEASLDARQKASRLIERRIVSKDGVLDNLKYSTAELFVETFKLTLVPVWVSSYHVQTQKYAVLINGHSGEVQTEMPGRGLSGWLKDKLNF